jgi:hypothetical protein
MSLPTYQRKHAIDGLSPLANYAGYHNVWKDICGKYQLGWGDSEEKI